MLITPEYIQQNIELHEKSQTYGSGGHRWASRIQGVADRINNREPITILDYGCGKGTLKKEIIRHTVFEYDPAIKGKDYRPMPADLVVCLDVMEHIEPDCLDDVLGHLHNLTGKVFFCTIATRPAKKKLSDGRNAHLIVETQQWWSKKLANYFAYSIRHEPKQKGEYVFQGTPKGVCND